MVFDTRVWHLHPRFIHVFGILTRAGRKTWFIDVPDVRRYRCEVHKKTVRFSFCTIYASLSTTFLSWRRVYVNDKFAELRLIHDTLTIWLVAVYRDIIHVKTAVVFIRHAVCYVPRIVYRSDRVLLTCVCRTILSEKPKHVISSLKCIRFRLSNSLTFQPWSKSVCITRQRRQHGKQGTRTNVLVLSAFVFRPATSYDISRTNFTTAATALRGRHVSRATILPSRSARQSRRPVESQPCGTFPSASPAKFRIPFVFQNQSAIVSLDCVFSPSRLMNERCSHTVRVVRRSAMYPSVYPASTCTTHTTRTRITVRVTCARVRCCFRVDWKREQRARFERTRTKNF